MENINNIYSFASNYNNLGTEYIKLTKYISDYGIEYEYIILMDNTKINMGTLLYISCISNNDILLKILLKLNANPNYILSSENSYETPLLHCIKLGYDECFNILLLSNKIDITIKSSYNIQKISNILIYEYGYYNIAFIAYLHKRYDILIYLITNYKHLIIEEDDLKYNLSDIIYMEILSNIENNIENNITDNILTDIYNKYLSSFTQIKYNSKNEYIKKKQDICIIKTEEYKNYILNNKVKNIEKYYKQLYNEIYSFEYIKTMFSLQKGVTIYDNVFLHKNIFENIFCDKLYKEFLNYVEFAKNNLNLDLPLYFRHDNNICLNNSGFDNILKYFEEIINKLIKLDNIDIPYQQVFHAFLICNNINRKENFKIHCDKSIITFNLCLYKSDDLEGSSVGFYKTPNIDEIPTEEDREYTYNHTKGTAIIHKGNVWHKADNLILGNRISLLIWTQNLVS